MYIEVIHQGKSLMSEAYRTLRSNIQFSNYGEGLKTLVVTSSNPSEGKSTTVLNVAASFAQIGKKVLVIDADMRHPTQNHLQDLSNSQGLSTLLSGQHVLNDLLEEVEQEGLTWTVLTAGPIPPNPAEMLHSLAMSRLIEQLRSHYDLILIDTPPLLAVTDAQILARIADATLLVVDSQQTTRKQLLESKKRLDSVQANLIGTVMNKVETDTDGYYYYHY